MLVMMRLLFWPQCEVSFAFFLLMLPFQVSKRFALVFPDISDHSLGQGVLEQSVVDLRRLLPGQGSANLGTIRTSLGLLQKFFDGSSEIKCDETVFAFWILI